MAASHRSGVTGTHGALFSRRFVLRGGVVAGALLGGGLMPGFARRALAQADAGRKTFVFLFLRGALDGLAVLSPFGDPRFARLRPRLALPEPGGARGPALLDVGVPGFGLHPALAPLSPLWREGTLAFVHAVGSPDSTRSHFDAQDYLELGTPGRKDTKDGFLSRALGGQIAPTEAVAVTERLPRCLQGSGSALAFASLDQLRVRPIPGGPRGPTGRAASRAAFEALYASSDDAPLVASGKEAFAAVELLEGKLAGFDTRAVDDYPRDPLGRSLRLLAALIKSDVGLRVGFAEAGGWDTHAAQPGVLEQRLAILGGALAAFRADLGRRIDDVVLVAATEFGRTVRENGAAGTDHGHGSVAFVLGGHVAGGKIHGRWPGLADDRLYEGRDLAVTTDLRSVLAAALQAQLGARDVFPGFAGPVLTQLVRS